MFDHMKYIIVEMGNIEIPIIFDSLINHDQIGLRPGIQSAKKVSAGFCDLVNDGESQTLRVCCFGESTSLKLKSRPEDAEVIKKAILKFLHC